MRYIRNARIKDMEPERLFKLKIYDRLLQWKESSKGKSALLIEGARRIGKSTIVNSFYSIYTKSEDVYSGGSFLPSTIIISKSKPQLYI